MRREWKRKLDPQIFGWEFDVTRFGDPPPSPMTGCAPELSEDDRRSYDAYLDQYLVLKKKASYGWSNNIGAVYHSGVGLVALARLGANPAARPLLAHCIATIKDPFYKTCILPHEDSGYPEGPLYRSYALLWTLAFVDAYERVTGDKGHGLLDPPFFRNSSGYVETLLGGDGVPLTFNDCQPQYYGPAWAAYPGARYDLPLCRWFADHCLTEGMRKRLDKGTGSEIGAPYTVFGFLWRDDMRVEFPGLPTLSILPSLNIGALRSDRSVRPGLMVAVRGRGTNEIGHNQPDTGSFVLYARGENYLIDPGYYQPESEKHSLLLVNGKGPQRAARRAGKRRGKGGLAWLAVDATQRILGPSVFAVALSWRVIRRRSSWTTSRQRR